jgi:hypothetical protein
MKKPFLASVLLACAISVFGQEKLLTPKEFLGYELGERFTPHYRVVEYYRHVSSVASNVKFVQYGETYEHRPLIYVAITSQENFSNLEQIRQDNLRRAGILQGTAQGDRKAIVWLSYNVHGNEANSMEASMWTLYELVNTSNPKTQEWLKHTVVILDPCINPDGRDRYANFYNQYGNQPPNPNGDAKEHREPWPGGRTNHYMFDLNRDWAWITQKESKHRIRAYNQWLPHVHVDFHEQGHNNPYFFAPAAEPFHEVISTWQREFQKMIGKNNAKYFDEQGWLYFTKEVFDLYYPSYGDTYPTYNGAIGMTYEQAGGPFGGLTITTETGDPLTLRDRLTHHHTTGLSTIEITSMNASRVVSEFEKYFSENINTPASPYKTYILRGTNNPDKLNRITAWFDAHNIRYGYATDPRSVKVFDFGNQNNGILGLTKEDLIVSAYQPKSRFLTTVFEPVSKLPDSLTYDITAWNLMYAYDLRAFASTEKLPHDNQWIPQRALNKDLPKKPYAYIFRYKSLEDVELLTTLIQNGIKVRAAEKKFTSNGTQFDAGTLLVPRRNNESIATFDSVVISVANRLNRTVYTASSGFVDMGKDLGSSDVNFIKAPRIATVFGEQTYSLSSGEIWHFFEQQVHYPITQLGTEYFRNIDLKKYDVLIVPEGSYRIFDEAMTDMIASWVSGGGKLILVGNALNAFAEKKGFDLKPYTSEDEKSKAEKAEKEKREKDVLARYEDSERKQISETIGGAIYKVQLDQSHPLGFGLSNTYYTLKTNELRFGFLENGWNVGVIAGKAKPVQGFAGHNANKKLENSLVFGVQDKGQGSIVYLVDNPLFRSFWENGKMIFSNAVFLVGN